MVVPIIILLVVVAAAITIGVLAWRRRKPKGRMVSIVGLLREPLNFSGEMLARAGARAWEADLGDGSTEGADGFVASVGPLTSIVHDGKMYVIHSFPTPYDSETEKTAEGIADLRIRALFKDHRAWFSCDAMGLDGASTEEEVRSAYRQSARLFSELIDENCLLIFLPEWNMCFPINGDTIDALAADNPVEALHDSQTVPVVAVSSDDPLMLEAVAKARETWPAFVEALDAGLGENFAVKAPVTAGGNTEFIWISVTGTEGGRIYGVLANQPADLAHLKQGSKVSVQVDQLNDWVYISPEGKTVGGHTIEALNKALARKRKT